MNSLILAPVAILFIFTVSAQEAEFGQPCKVALIGGTRCKTYSNTVSCNGTLVAPVGVCHCKRGRNTFDETKQVCVGTIGEVCQVFSYAGQRFECIENADCVPVNPGTDELYNRHCQCLPGFYVAEDDFAKTKCISDPNYIHPTTRPPIEAVPPRGSSSVATLSIVLFTLSQLFVLRKAIFELQ